MVQSIGSYYSASFPKRVDRAAKFSVKFDGGVNQESTLSQADDSHPRTDVYTYIWQLERSLYNPKVGSYIAGGLIHVANSKSRRSDPANHRFSCCGRLFHRHIGAMVATG